MALGLLLPGSTAFFAKPVLRPLVERSSATHTVLRRDTSELCAVVAVRAASSAAIQGVPVEAHILLPEAVIAQRVHPVAEDSIKDREILPDLRPMPREIKPLLYCWHRLSCPERPFADHSPDLVGVFRQIGVVNLPADCLFRLSDAAAYQGVAVAVPNPVSDDLQHVSCPPDRFTGVFRLDRALFQAEVGTSSLDRSRRAVEHFRQLRVSVSVELQEFLEAPILIGRPAVFPLDGVRPVILVPLLRYPRGFFAERKRLHLREVKERPVFLGPFPKLIDENDLCREAPPSLVMYRQPSILDPAFHLIGVDVLSAKCIVEGVERYIIAALEVWRQSQTIDSDHDRVFAPIKVPADPVNGHMTPVFGEPVFFFRRPVSFFPHVPPQKNVSWPYLFSL